MAKEREALAASAELAGAHTEARSAKEEVRAAKERETAAMDKALRLENEVTQLRGELAAAALELEYSAGFRKEYGAFKARAEDREREALARAHKSETLLIHLRDALYRESGLRQTAEALAERSAVGEVAARQRQVDVEDRLQTEIHRFRLASLAHSPEKLDYDDKVSYQRERLLATLPAGSPAASPLEDAVAGNAARLLARYHEAQSLSDGAVAVQRLAREVDTMLNKSFPVSHSPPAPLPVPFRSLTSPTTGHSPGA